MDISVSRLNNRLALQLPAELPLGLVFVVGTIENLSQHVDSRSVKEGPKVCFDLVEKDYRLRCELTSRAAAEVNLNEGERVRAGGHLVFDAQQANYYLLARDIELLQDDPVSSSQSTEQQKNPRSALTPVLADIKRRAEAARLAPADLPEWVQRMAPPEIWAKVAPAEAEEQHEVEETAASLDEEDEAAEHLPETMGLNEELLSFLSSAMDDQEDLEVTPEVIQDIVPGATLLSSNQSVPHLYETTTPQSSDRLQPAISHQVFVPDARRETDWLVILLILSFLILTAAVIVAAVLLLFR